MKIYDCSFESKIIGIDEDKKRTFATDSCNVIRETSI